MPRLHAERIMTRGHYRPAQVQLQPPRQYSAHQYSAWLLGLSMACGTAHADLTALSGRFSNDIEEASAAASQAVYDQLKAAGCDDQQAGPTASCGGDRYTVWSNVREVVHNANVLAGNDGPTQYSLGRTSVALLGRALQWCSGEEFTAMGSMTSSFIGSQISSLATRISALRFGSSQRFASTHNALRPLGGAASADAEEGLGSAWSGYVNGDYAKGDHDVTKRENAFDLISRQVSAGVDRRLNASWVAGVMAGYQRQSLNFIDVLPGATTNVVDAANDTRGVSLMPYVLFQGERWYFNTSLGYQQLEFESTRHVNYASGPAATVTVSHNTIAISESEADSWSLYSTLGHSWRPVKPLSIEPSLSVDWRHINIDQFREQDLSNDGFDFVVDKQRINSLELIPALRLQYTFSPRWGVWTPYLDAQWHHQLKDQSRTINAMYADAAGVLNDSAKFAIHTDAPDGDYQVYTAGLSLVTRGGMQFYASYRGYAALENYKLYSVSAGMRVEF